MSVSGVVFLLAFLGALVLSITRNPLYGLYAYIGVFYLHPPSRWWGEQLPDMRWSMLAAAVTILSIWIRNPPDFRRSWLSSTPARIMLLFVCWFWMSSLWALDPDQHIPEAVKLSKYLLVFYMVYRLVDTPQKCLTLLFSHVLGCLYLGLLAYSAGGGGRLDGVGGPGIDDSNTLGMQLSTAVVGGGVLVLHLKNHRLVATVIAVAFSLNGMVLTGSRGAFLALVAGGLAVLCVRPQRYARKFYLLAALGVVAIGAVASQQFWERLQTIQAFAPSSTEEREKSAESRLALASAQLQMAREHPFGAGHRGTEVLSGAYLDPAFLTASGQRSSHNAFLTVLVEQGVPGVILSLCLIWWTLVAVLEGRRKAIYDKDTEAEVSIAAIFGALMVVFVGGIFADFSHCEVQIWMFALLAGLRAFQQQKKDPATEILRRDQPASQAVR